MTRDTATAVGLVVLCAVLVAATFDIRETNYATPGAEVWPRIVLAWLSGLSLVYLGRSLVRARRARGAEAERGPGLPANVVWCFVLFAAFLLSLPLLGMLVGGVLFVFAALSVMGRKDLRAVVHHAVIAVVSVGAVWAVFTFALHVILPAGALFGI
jgi:putative tricarboxylic transport membrane protein